MRFQRAVRHACIVSKDQSLSSLFMEYNPPKLSGKSRMKPESRQSAFLPHTTTVTVCLFFTHQKRNSLYILSDLSFSTCTGRSKLNDENTIAGQLADLQNKNVE